MASPSKDQTLLWRAVDRYVEDTVLAGDAALGKVRSANAAAGLPAIDVSAPQGKFLSLLVQISAAKRILEIGTLGGYSTLWMARALPDGGKIVTLEADAHHAEVARRNFATLGLGDRIDLIDGKALDTLPTLSGPFDFVFIDADKGNNPHYLEWAVKLSRPGTVVICDNVVREGAVLDAKSRDPSVTGTRSLLKLMGEHPRLAATVLQTVGDKDWDGFAMAIVR